MAVSLRRSSKGIARTLRVGLRIATDMSSQWNSRGLRGHLQAGLRNKWSGRILRGGIAATPLFLVIGLCIIMFSWRGNKSDAEITTPQPPITSAQTVSPSQEGQTTDASLAAFQRMHVVHSTVRVPQ